MVDPGRGNVGRGRGEGRRGKRGKRMRSSEEGEVADIAPQPHPSARQFTPQIIRTLDDLDDFHTFTSPCIGSGSTLIRRVVENESVYTRKKQLSETSPILGTLDLQDHHLSRSPIDISSSDSTLLGAEEHKYVDTALFLKSDSHKSNSADKVNDVSEGALVGGGTEHNTSVQLENSNSRMEVPAVNLPTMLALPCHDTQRSASNSHEESRHDYPSPTHVHENVGSSSINNGSIELAASSNITQMVEELGFGRNFEADSLETGNGALVSLKGYDYDYKVKPEHVGILASILSKHGDIGAKCTMASDTFRAIGMGLLCDIVETLKNTKPEDMTKEDLEKMMTTISDLKEERVNVGWLKKRLDEIFEAEKATRTFSNLKELHGEQLTKAEMIKKKLEEYKAAIAVAESDLSVVETETSQIENLITELKPKIKHVYKLESFGSWFAVSLISVLGNILGLKSRKHKLM